jgi:hypothetical protein
MSTRTVIAAAIALIPCLAAVIATLRLSRFRVDRDRATRSIAFPFDGWGNMLDPLLYEEHVRPRVTILAVLFVLGGIGVAVGGAVMGGIF